MLSNGRRIKASDCSFINSKDPVLVSTVVSLQRAIKRGGHGPKNSLDTAQGWEGGGRKQRGKKASEKRPTAWRDLSRIELQRLCSRVVFLFPSSPFSVAFRLSLRISCLCASWCSRPCSILFCFVLLARTSVPPSGRLPAAPLYSEAGGARVPIFTFLCYILFCFFTSHSV